MAVNAASNEANICLSIPPISIPIPDNIKGTIKADTTVPNAPIINGSIKVCNFDGDDDDEGVAKSKRAIACGAKSKIDEYTDDEYGSKFILDKIDDNMNAVGALRMDDGIR